MRFGLRLNICARPRRPTVDGAPPLVHLHNLYAGGYRAGPPLTGRPPDVHLHSLYAGGQRTACISIFLTPAKTIRHIKRQESDPQSKMLLWGSLLRWEVEMQQRHQNLHSTYFSFARTTDLKILILNCKMVPKRFRRLFPRISPAWLKTVSGAPWRQKSPPGRRAAGQVRGAATG